MKKLITLTLFICLCLSACSSPDPSPESKSSADSSSSVSSEIQSSDPEELSSSEESAYYFKDNILKKEDATIEIIDYRVIPAGEEGNKYGDSPVVAFWYKTTNNSDEAINPTTAWMYSITAIQDNDPNFVNELNVGSLPDSKFRDTQMADIKPGGTLENAIAYELDDLETPVMLKARNGLFGDELGEIEFSIK